MANKLYESCFIIGAGAHVPYDMPTNLTLKAKIKAMYDCPTPFRLKVSREAASAKPVTPLTRKTVLFSLAKHLNLAPVSNGHDPDHHTATVFNKFLKSFCESHVPSIDYYLSNIHLEKDDYVRMTSESLGKLTLAYLIYEAENNNPLGARNEDWIQNFINSYVRPNPELFFRRPPTIITFNYDRLFERMLYTHLIEHHKMIPEMAQEKVDGLDVIHVYGRLGCYSNWYEPFHTETALGFFNSALENISVIGATRTNEEIMTKIKNALWNCTNIYFLGFGFDEINCNLLMKARPLNAWGEHQKLYSTSIGIKKSDLMRVQETMGTTKMFHYNKPGKINSYDCMDLLYEVAPLK